MNSYTGKYLVDALGSTYSIQQFNKTVKTSTFKRVIGIDLNLAIEDARRADLLFGELASFIQGLRDSQQYYYGYRLWMILLKEIQSSSPDQYLCVHKGTAFYFAANNAFLDSRPMQGYELMDYALQEDLTNFKTFDTPAGWAISLDEAFQGNDDGWQHQVSNLFQHLILPNFSKKKYVLKSKNVKNLTKIVKRYFLKQGAIYISRRSALYSLFAIMMQNFPESLDFIYIGPKENQSQVYIKHNLSFLCLSAETLLRFSPRLRRKINMNPSWSMYNYINAISSVNRSFSNTTFEQSVQKFQSLINNKTELIDKFIETDSLSSTFALLKVMRNDSNHSFTQSIIDKKSYGVIIEELIYINLWIIFYLYN